MRTLIFHSLRMRRIQTFSLVLSVALSVMVILVLSLVYGGVKKGVQLNALRSGAELMVVSKDAALEVDDSALLFTGAPAPIYISSATAERISQLDGVKRCTTQFFSQTLNQSCCSTTGATRLIGADFSTDWTAQAFAHLELPESLGENAIIVGSKVSNGPGSTVTILGEDYTVLDQLDPSGTDLDHSILMDMDVARSISESQQGFQYLWDRYGSPEELISVVLIDYDDEYNESQLTSLVNRITALDGLSVIQRSNVVDSAQESLETVFLILLGAGAIMLLSTILQLYARFHSCVWERKSELALYRAVGASAKDIKRLIGGEVAVVTGTGLVAGFALGALLQGILVSILSKTSSFPYVDLSLGAIGGVALGIVAVFALISALAVLLPLRQIQRLDPSMAMQQGDID